MSAKLITSSVLKKQNSYLDRRGRFVLHSDPAGDGWRVVHWGLMVEVHFLSGKLEVPVLVRKRQDIHHQRVSSSWLPHGQNPTLFCALNSLVTRICCAYPSSEPSSLTDTLWASGPSSKPTHHSRDKVGYSLPWIIFFQKEVYVLSLRFKHWLKVLIYERFLN